VGVQANPKNLCIGENPGKIHGNLVKICEDNLKIAICALILQNVMSSFPPTFWRQQIDCSYYAASQRFGLVA